MHRTFIASQLEKDLRSIRMVMGLLVRSTSANFAIMRGAELYGCLSKLGICV